MGYRRFLLLLALLMAIPAAAAQGVADTLRVVGVVTNAVDGNGLPLCVVQLMQGGVSKARGVSGSNGEYALPPVAAGSYDIVVVQFGDTLCHYRGLALTRSTRIWHYVQPPTGELAEPTIDYSLGIRLLRPATIRVYGGNMLRPLGLLITSPDDPRLWNFSGRMDPLEDMGKSFWWNRSFYKLRAMGYDITSPFELIYPEIKHPASDSAKYNYRFWVFGIKIK